VHLVDTSQDSELVAEAQGGNLQVFEELVRRHTQLIYRALKRAMGIERITHQIRKALQRANRYWEIASLLILKNLASIEIQLPPAAALKIQQVRARSLTGADVTDSVHSTNHLRQGFF
jgi:hypothetical protein